MSATQPSPPGARFRLRALGSVALLGADREPILGTHGHHRRRLALLAALAAAGEDGRTRDQLLLFFWPESTQARARHSLEQLLYAIRTALGESPFAGTNPMRLESAVVTSDVGEFNEAIDRGELERAVDLYRGPFLDGFHLSDAPEFERWVESERARLALRYTGALDRLARAADAARDDGAAVRWWRRLAEADPVSSTWAAGLIRALMRSGDHAAALQHAERHEAFVAQELGTGVGPALTTLVAEVRENARTANPAAGRDAPFARRGDAALAAARSPDSPASRPSPGTPPVETAAPPDRTRTILRVGVLAAALGIATLALRTRLTEGTPAAREVPSLAVLPFKASPGDASDSVFADGLAGELIVALSRIEPLRVMAQESSFGFRNRGIDVRLIGDSLGADNLVTATVSRDGDRLRVQVTLIDARDGSTRWSESYDRRLADLFAVQRDIAESIAAELRLRLSPPAQRALRRTTDSIAAWDLYVRGRDPVHLRTDSGPRVGLAQLQAAVAIDPSFAHAWAAMPQRYFGLSGSATSRAERLELKRLALAAAHRAIALDSLLPEAYTGLGVALAIAPADLGASRRAMERALELGGAPRTREHLSRQLTWSGRFTEALAQARRAAAEDPRSPSAAADIGEGLCLTGRIDEGLRQLGPLWRVSPPPQRVRNYTALCLALAGRWADAIDTLDVNGQVHSPGLMGFALARSGRVDDARRLMDEAMAQWERTGRGAGVVVAIATGLRDIDLAAAWLDRAADEGMGIAPLAWPLFADLHADPRYARYRARIGLVP